MGRQFNAIYRRGISLQTFVAGRDISHSFCRRFAMSNKTLHSSSQTLHFSVEKMEYYREFMMDNERQGKRFLLLLSGHFDPPLREVDGGRISGYVGGTIVDIGIVQNAIPWTRDKYHWVGRDANGKLTKQEALEMIRSGFEMAKFDTMSDYIIIEIYYSGHGEESSGDWCFSNDDRISLQDILEIARQNSAHFDCLNLLSNACESGNWCQKLDKLKEKVVGFDVNIYAASWPERSAWCPNEGSFWTRFMYKKNEMTDSTEEHEQIRWSRSSLTRDGLYKMTHMNATNDVQDQVETTSGKVEKLKKIVEQFDSSGLS